MTPTETINEAVQEAIPAKPALKDFTAALVADGLARRGNALLLRATGALSVAAPFMSEDLGFNPAQTGVLLSAFFWVYAFMQMPAAGWLIALACGARMRWLRILVADLHRHRDDEESGDAGGGARPVGRGPGGRFPG
jgi:hypothetical protein